MPIAPHPSQANTLIYLATPYTHSDPDVRAYRYRCACRAAAALMAEGHLVYSPIAHSHPIALSGELPGHFEFWQRQCLAWLDRCDELWVLTMDGWQESRGVRAEMEYWGRVSFVRLVEPTESDLRD